MPDYLTIAMHEHVPYQRTSSVMPSELALGASEDEDN